MVVEEVIQRGERSIGKLAGTLDFQNESIMVSINEQTGTVITVIPKH